MGSSLCSRKLSSAKDSSRRGKTNQGENMRALEMGNNGLGTSDWLEATKNLVLRAYIEDAEPSHGRDTPAFSEGDFDAALRMVSRRVPLSVPEEASSGT